MPLFGLVQALFSLCSLIGSSKVIKVDGKQKPYEMWQAGNSLARFAREYGGSAARSPAPESRLLRRLDEPISARLQRYPLF